MAKTVVVIDDDVDDLEIIRHVLKTFNPNIHCITYSNSVDAIRDLVKKKSIIPDYIFIDINMPMISGPECLSEIRKIEALDDVSIIMFSTTMLAVDTVKLMKMGATYTFQKPSSMAGYFEIVKQLIQIPLI